MTNTTTGFNQPPLAPPPPRVRLAARTPGLRWLAAAMLGLLAGLAGAAEHAQPQRREWKIDGTAREALVYAPPSAAKTASPLVFGFHGHGGTMRNAAASFRLHECWTEAAVVYMQGLPTPGVLTDPEGKKPGWQKSVGDQGDRDLKFFDAVMETMKKDYKIDPTRIYATGHSNGGAFTYLLWSARGEAFAAVAPSGSAARNARDLKPKPALHLAGQADPLVRYRWQEAMMQAVRRVNGCEDEGKPWASSGDLVGTIYPSKGGTPFVSLIHPGGHKFPPQAPELIVRFFREHPAK